MNKREKIFLVIGITVVASIFTILSVEDRILGFAGIIGVFLLSILIADPMDFRTKKEIGAEKEDDFGSEVLAAVDSRIYERPSSFIGLPVIVVFGGIGSKYESVFSIWQDGKAVVVLYHGLCIVSAGDRLLVRGNWYRGRKLGIQEDIVVADRVENLSSGIVFEKV